MRARTTDYGPQTADWGVAHGLRDGVAGAPPSRWAASREGHGGASSREPVRTGSCGGANTASQEFRPPALKNVRCSGFTLIELLAAMAILVVITLIVSQLFQQANVSWDTGLRKAESTMTGRALADYIAQDLASAVMDLDNYPDFTASGSTLAFWSLQESAGGQRAVNYVSYDSGGKRRVVKDAPGGATIETADLVGGGTTVSLDVQTAGATPTNLPLYATVKITVNGALQYQSTAYFSQRNRNSF